MALAALCDDSEWGRTWSALLQHRFTSEGDLDNHAVGNLLIVALWELLDDPVAGLDWVGKLLGARGACFPWRRCRCGSRRTSGRRASSRPSSGRAASR